MFNASSSPIEIILRIVGTTIRWLRRQQQILSKALRNDSKIVCL